MRKKRATISTDILKSIRKDIDRNCSITDISKNENISLPTAYKIVHKISDGMKDEESLKNKKGRKKIDKCDLKSKVSQLLIGDASFTQAEIAGKLNEIDHASFKSFIQEKLVSHFGINRFDILIMDNCQFHHRKDIIELLDANNIKYRFLPPYSPQLNPIEEYFSHFKSQLSAFQ